MKMVGGDDLIVFMYDRTIAEPFEIVYPALHPLNFLIDEPAPELPQSAANVRSVLENQPYVMFAEPTLSHSGVRVPR